MKAFITIQKDDVALGAGKVVYNDSEGKECLGRPLTAPVGTRIVVEITNTPMEDGYYHIVRVLSRIGE